MHRMHSSPECLPQADTRWLRRLLIVVTASLLVAGLAACGRSRTPSGLPTEVPTLAVQPTATLEPTATTAPAPTDTPVSASTEPSATTPATSTIAVTTTTVVTETAPVSTTPTVTTSVTISPAAAVTTTAVTGMTGMTETSPVTSTPAVTTAKATTQTVAPRVFFRQPTNGATLPLTSTVVMGAEGLKVEPAGEVKAGAGHFHILIDTDFIPAGDVIPKDATHLHFGNGQLTTPITLTEGIHVLRLQFANGAHIALDGPQYRDTITVTVKAGAPAQSVHFVTPTNGATVSDTFPVEMAATGLLVEPAGEIHPNAGHFHILIDTDFAKSGDPVIKDAQHLHYGQGQTHTTLTLQPGQHVLRLQFANGAHIALDGPQYRDEITVTVPAK